MVYLTERWNGAITTDWSNHKRTSKNAANCHDISKTMHLPRYFISFLAPLKRPTSPHSPLVLFRRRGSGLTSLQETAPWLLLSACSSVTLSKLERLSHSSGTLQGCTDAETCHIDCVCNIHNQRLWIYLKYVYYRLLSNWSGKTVVAGESMMPWLSCPPWFRSFTWRQLFCVTCVDTCVLLRLP